MLAFIIQLAELSHKLMAKYSQQIIRFLRKHSVDESLVFDAAGMCTKDWKENMRSTGMILAIGVSPCKLGHKLRTRGGHCVQCDPSKLAFQKRYDDSGFVYVAYSKKLKVVKIGSAYNVVRRAQTLNEQIYGGGQDWVIKKSWGVDNVGRVENNAQRILMKYNATFQYLKEDRVVTASELFKCSIKAGILAVQSAINNMSGTESERVPQDKNINFKILKSKKTKTISTSKVKAAISKKLNNTQKVNASNQHSANQELYTELYPLKKPFRSTHEINIKCNRCRKMFSVTLIRYELLAMCPNCMKLCKTSVHW